MNIIGQKEKEYWQSPPKGGFSAEGNGVDEINPFIEVLGKGVVESLGGSFSDVNRSAVIKIEIDGVVVWDSLSISAANNFIGTSATRAQTPGEYSNGSVSPLKFDNSFKVWILSNYQNTAIIHVNGRLV